MSQSGRLEFVRLISFSFLAQIVNFAVPVFTIPIILGRIGVSEYGHYVFCLTLFSLVGVILDYDYNVSGIILLAKNEEVLGDILSSKGLLFIACIFFIFMTFLFVPALKIAIVPAVIYAMSAAMNYTFVAIYRLNNRLILISSLISRLALLASTIVIVNTEFLALLSWSVSMLIYSMIIFVSIVVNKPTLNVSIAGGFKYIISGYYSFLVQVTGFFAGNIHVFTANYLLSPQYFGQLALFDRIMRVGLSIFSVINQNVLRRIEDHRGSRELYISSLKRYSFWIVAFFTLSIAISPAAISFVNFGIDFRYYIYSPLFVIMGLWCVVCIINGFFGVNFFQYNGYYKSYTISYGFSILVSLLFIFLLSRPLNALGVAIGILIGELMIVPVNYLLYIKGKK